MLYKFRTSIIKFVFVVIFATLIVQLFRLQVVEHDKWKARSSQRDIFSNITTGQRGIIYFSDGSPIALDETKYRFYIHPENFHNDVAKNNNIDKDSFAEFILPYSQYENKEEILEIISQQDRSRVIIGDNLDKEQVEIIIEEYPLGLYITSFESFQKRLYPNKEIASKFTGFVGFDDDKNRIGRYGVEEYFDGILKGTEGILEGKKDKKNRIIVNEDFDSVLPKNGVDLTLTIDRNIQMILDERMMYWMDQFKSREATAVVMEPNTGRILGVSNLPTYDPNEYYQGENVNCDYEYYVIHKDCNEEEEKDKDEKEKEEDKENEETEDKKEEEKEEEIDPRIARYNAHVREIFREEDLDAEAVFRNAANSSIYEPGSVIKVLTLATAYHHNAIPRDPSFQLGGHEGCLDIADRVICTADRRPRRSLTVMDTIRDSDNIGALRIAQSVERQKFVKTFMDFGLGKGTDVELADENIFHTKQLENWTLIDQSTASYGQGSVAYTPIQLTSAWNTLASDGAKYKTTLLKSRNDNGEIKEFAPELVEQVVDKKAAKDTVDLVAEASKTTGPLSAEFYSKYSFAGKTGTASVPDPKSGGYLPDVVNTTYVGHTPVENPEITLLIWFREPRLSYIGSTVPNASDTSFIAWMDIAERILLSKNVRPKN